MAEIVSRYLTGPQLDARLGISRRTRHRLLKAGRLPLPVRFGPSGSRPRWSVEEIEAFERRAAAERVCA